MAWLDDLERMFIVSLAGWPRSLQYQFFPAGHRPGFHHLHLQDPGGEDGGGGQAEREGGGVHVPRLREVGQAECGLCVGPRVPAPGCPHYDAETG